METSFANGGQLSASNAEVWNHWSTILKGIKWMLRRDAPLLMNPTPSWHKYTWLLEFVSNISRYRENTIETTRLAIAARKHLFDIADREGIDFDHVRRGMLNEGGLDRRSVTPGEIAGIEPALHGNFYGGFYTPSDSTGDIHKYCAGLEKACTKRGAQFIYDAAVTRIGRRDRLDLAYTTGGADQTLEADGIVVCAGTNSRDIAAMFGDRVNVYPVKGYSITVGLERSASDLAPWVSILDDRAKIVTSRLGAARLRVAGTAEFNGVNFDIREDRIRPLVDWTRMMFPKVATEHVVPWAGLRPMMPNMMPRVGKSRVPGVFYNTGHGHLGWTLSAATSATLATVVATDLPVDARLAA
ncbi:MAG: FAD-dependent oxidoreductase, partial [Mesorhizobium sp.]